MGMMSSVYHLGGNHATNKAPAIEIDGSDDVFSYIHDVFCRMADQEGDDEDSTGIDKYISLLCNPSLENSPSSMSAVSPLVKIFHLADLYNTSKNTSCTFTLQEYILDSVHHRVDVSTSTVDVGADNRGGKYSSYGGIDLATMGTNDAHRVVVVSKIKAYNMFCLDVNKVSRFFVGIIDKHTDACQSIFDRSHRRMCQPSSAASHLVIIAH